MAFIKPKHHNKPNIAYVFFLAGLHKVSINSWSDVIFNS